MTTINSVSRSHAAWLAIPLTCLALAILPGDGKAAAAVETQSPIKATADLYARISARDLDGVSQYLPDAGFSEFGVGASSLTQLARQNFAAFFKSDTAISLHTENLAAQEFGDTTIVTGWRVGSMTPKGQPVKVERAALTMVWVKTDGRWQVRHVHLSAFKPDAVGP
jgi:ketosteroid isomerase-like protein